MAIDNSNSNLTVTNDGWHLLATLDESLDYYETDVAEVWRTPTGYALLTASGCSCWAGNYDTDEYTSLPLLALALLREERQYNPSLNGALALLREVFSNDR